MMKKKKSKKCFRVFQIPLDCVSLITDYFENAQTFFSLQSSCKFFNEILMDKEFHGNKHIFFTAKANNQEDGEEKEIQEIEIKPKTTNPLPYVQKIRFTNSSKEITFRTFKNWRNKFINLRVIHFDGNFKLNYLPIANPKLDVKIEELKIIDFDISIHNGQSFKPLQNFPKLQKLYFEPSFFDMNTFKIEYFPELQDLTIFIDSYVKETSTILPKLAKLPTLKKLGFQIYSQGNMNELDFSVLKNIKEMELSLMYYCIDPKLTKKKMFSGMNNLSKLTINGYEFEKEIFQGCNALETVNIFTKTKKKRIELSTINYLIKNIKTLKNISIENHEIIENENSFEIFKKQRPIRISLCCSEFFLPSQFNRSTINSTLYLYGMNGKKREVKTIKCKNCMYCRCGSKEKNLIACSNDDMCNSIGCKDCFYCCKDCNQNFCKNCEPIFPKESKKCEICKFSTYCSRVNFSDCIFCKKKICFRGPSESRCGKECPNCSSKVCKDCAKIHLLYCSKCKDYTRCDGKDCYYCHVCKKGVCMKCSEDELVLCACGSDNCHHFACKNHCKEINGKKFCDLCKDNPKEFNSNTQNGNFPPSFNIPAQLGQGGVPPPSFQ